MARYGLARYDAGFRYDAVTDLLPHSSATIMASNTLPKRQSSLFTLAEDAADGAHQYEAALGLTHVTEAILRAGLAAARGAEQDYQDAGTGKAAAVTAQQLADSNGKAFIGNARRRLAKFFGDTYNAQWGAAGWPDNSVATPSRQEDRLDLLGSLKTHLTAHAAHASAEMEVTAALADTRFQALSDARAATANCVTLVGQKKGIRDVAVANVRKLLRDLISELATQMDDLDPRWHAFGLSMPGESDIPEVPENLVLTAGLPTVVLADWADALRADRYRVFVQVVGVDADFRHLLTVNDSDATLPGLPTGATVKVRVTAVNTEGDESQPSAEMQIVVP